MNDRVAVLLSGGLDSAVMLAQLVKHYQHVQPVYLRCGLFWEEMELEFLRKFLSAFNNTAIQEVQELSLQLDDVFGEGWYTHSTRRHLPLVGWSAWWWSRGLIRWQGEGNRWNL